MLAEAAAEEAAAAAALGVRRVGTMDDLRCLDEDLEDRCGILHGWDSVMSRDSAKKADMLDILHKICQSSSPWRVQWQQDGSVNSDAGRRVGWRARRGRRRQSAQHNAAAAQERGAADAADAGRAAVPPRRHSRAGSYRCINSCDRAKPKCLQGLCECCDHTVVHPQTGALQPGPQPAPAAMRGGL